MKELEAILKIFEHEEFDPDLYDAEDFVEGWKAAMGYAVRIVERAIKTKAKCDEQN